MNEERTYSIDVDGRFILSPIRATDRDAFVEHLNDRDIYDQTLRIPYPYTVENADTFLEIIQSTESKVGHPVHFAIRNEHDRLVGVLGFEGLCHGHRAEIGYWLARPYWGQGVMTRAVSAACELATVQWKLVRITADVFDFNQASARVLEKNSFRFEGTMRKMHLKDGKFIDAKLYALVR